MFIHRSCSQLHSNVRFIGRSVEFVNSVDLLGVPLYADLKVNHIHRNVQKYYCKVNQIDITQLNRVYVRSWPNCAPNTCRYNIEQSYWNIELQLSCMYTRIRHMYMDVHI